MSATLCLTFDNLGEAAEIGAGALAPDDPRVGSHPTATEVLPRLLDRLGDTAVAATFFLEGLNAELYPDLVRRIDGDGHEVAYHSWTHEQWGDLTPDEQAESLNRGVAAFEGIGLRLEGMRPPGGGLGDDGASTLRRAGLSYCSPAGEGAGVAQAEDDGADLALLPFEWRHVDVTCVLPQLAAVRERMFGSAEPVAPEAYLAFLEAELAASAEAGGFIALVFHPFMLEWLGENRLASFLDRVAAASARGDLRVLRCREIAAEIRASPERFAGGTRLDPTSWAA